MISRLEAMIFALRHRQLLSQLLEFRQNPSSVSYWSLVGLEQEAIKRAVDQTIDSSGPIIEIGTLFGFTTAMMASWMGQKRKLITVDNYSWNPWGLKPEVHRALTFRVLAPFTQDGAVTIADTDSESFMSNYDAPPPSFVFIDGDHSYSSVSNEIMWAKKTGASIIGGHDYHARAPGVIQAVDEHFPDGVHKSETVWLWGLK